MLALITVLPAFGDTIFTIDTSTLISNPNGPFIMDFQFSDFSGGGDGNNTVTLSNFSDPSSLTFVPGSAFGGVTVNSGPFSVTMTDSSFFDEVQFTLNPDATLSFDFQSTQNPEPGTPDTFIFDILDSSLNNIPTTNVNNGIAFIEVDLPTTDPTAATQIITSASTTNSDNVVIGAPSSGSSSVPEPSTLAAVCLGMLAIGCSSLRRLKTQRYIRSH